MPAQQSPCSSTAQEIGALPEKNSQLGQGLSIASCVHWQLRATIAANAPAAGKAAARPARLVSVEPPVVVVVALHMSLAAQ